MSEQESLQAKPERSIRSMTVDELEARIRQILVEVLPDDLDLEWLGDLEDDAMFDDEWRDKNRAELKTAFWMAARILLRDLVMHDVDVRLPPEAAK